MKDDLLNPKELDPETNLAEDSFEIDFSGVDITPQKGSNLERDARVNIGIDFDQYRDYLGDNVFLPTGGEEALKKERAQAQSGWEQAGRTAANMPVNIAVGVLENAGYLATLATEWGDDRDYTNSLTEWAKEQRNPFGDVYREDPNAVIDLSDPAWWYEQGGGLVESIGEFLVTGAGVGSVLGKGSALLAARLGTIGSQAATGAAQLGTAATLAYTEGAMSGATVYKDVYEKEFRTLKAQNISDEEATKLSKHKAAKAASETVQINTTINTALNITAVAPLFGSAKLIQQAEKLGVNRVAGESTKEYMERLVKMKAAGPQTKTPMNSLLRYGGEAAQESAEELTNVVAESMGMDTEGKKGFMGHLEEALTSEEGVLSMALGALGGVGQTGGMRSLRTNKIPELDAEGRPVKDKDGNIVYKKVSARTMEAATEEAVYEQYVTNIMTDLEDINTTSADLKQAALDGDTEKVEELQHKLFNIGMKNTVMNGSSYELKETYEEIAALTTEEAKERGLSLNADDTKYQEKAREAIQDIEEATKQWEDILTKNNYGDEEALGMGRHVFELWLAKTNTQKSIERLRDKNASSRSKIDNSDDHGAFNLLLEKEALEKAMEENAQKQMAIESVKKTRSGKLKLLRKYKTGNTIKQLQDNLIDEHIALQEQHKLATKKVNEAFEVFSEQESNKGKSQEELSTAFRKRITDNADVYQSILGNEAHAKFLETEMTSYGKAYEDLMSIKGRKNFVKAAKKDLDTRIEKSKARTTSNKKTAQSNTTKTQAAKARSKPAGANTRPETAPKKASPVTPQEPPTPEEGSAATATAPPTTETPKNAIDTAIVDIGAALGITPDESVLVDESPSTGMGAGAKAVAMGNLITALENEGRDLNDFIPIAIRASELLGAEGFASIYNHFRALYAAATEIPTIATDPKYDYNNIFRTESEGNFVSSEDIARKALLGEGQWHGLNNAQFQEVLKKIQEVTTKVNIDDDGNWTDDQGKPIGVGDLIIPAASAMAYLSQAYKEGTYRDSSGNLFQTLETSSNEILESMEDPMLLSPNAYQPGDKLTLKVDVNFLVKDSEGNEVTYDMLKDDPDTVPIGIFNSEDKLIAYVHLPDWVDSHRVADSPKGNLAKQQTLIKAVRNEIINNGPITTSIDSKSYGKLIYNTDKNAEGKNEYRTVSEAFPDPNLAITIGKQGQPFISSNSPYKIPDNGELINKEDLIEGLPYAIVPTPVKGKYIALPMNTSKLGKNYANSILNALDIYFQYKPGGKGEQTFSEEQKQIIKDLKTAGYDITTEVGMREYLSLFTYNSFLNTDNINDINKAEANGNKFIDLRERGIWFAQNGVGSGKAETLTEYQDIREELGNHIAEMYMHLNLNNLTKQNFQLPVIHEKNGVLVVEDFNGGDNYMQFVKDHTMTNLNSLDLGNGEFAYFGQPVITFDSSFAAEDTTNTAQTISVPGAAAVSSPDEPGGATFTVGNFTVNPADIKDVGDDSVSVDELPYELTPTQQATMAVSLKGIKLIGIPIFKQQQIIGSVNAIILDILNTSKKGKKVSMKDAYAKTKTFFEQGIAEGQADITKKLYGEVLDNWEDIVNISKLQMRTLGLINIQDSEGLQATSEEIENIENGIADIESNYEKLNYDDGLSFMIDAKNTMSSRLRQFFAFVPDGKTYLGLPAYKSFDQVINYLNETLAGVDATEEAMLGALRADIERNPWVGELVKLIDEAPQHIKNELITFGSKHYARFKRVLWEQKTITDANTKEVFIVPRLRIIDANQNAITKVIAQQWGENLKVSSIATLNNSTNEIEIDKAQAKAMSAKFDTIKGLAQKNDPSVINELQEWLFDMGIEMSTKALEEIKNNSKSLFNTSFNRLFIDASGIFKLMNDRLNDDTDKKDNSLYLRNPLLDNSGVIKLARVEAKYNQHHLSNSHKDGENKTIFSYAMNKAITHRVNNLKAGLMNDLKELPFTNVETTLVYGEPVAEFSNTLWGEKLLTDPYFKEKFNISYLDTLNKVGGKKGVKLTRMSPKEIELTKLGLFFNQGERQWNDSNKKDSVDNRYTSHFMMPTLSDKSTMPIITAIKHNIDLSVGDAGINIGDRTINELYKVAQAEITRIVSHQDKIKKNDSNYLGKNLKGYKEGANKFLLYPFLNVEFLQKNHPETAKQLWEGDQFIGNTPEAQKVIKELIKFHITNLIDDKVKSWTKDGIIEEAHNKDTGKNYIKTTFLDGDYMKKVVNKNIPNSVNDFGRKRAQYAAADFTINYLLATANTMQLIVGDPALYWKKDIETTWDNINKRLAAEIAPGLDIPNGINDKYQQLFLNDIIGESKYFKRINNLLAPRGTNSKGYKKIEIADAQEYTTASEHVHILYSMGKLTDEEYDSIMKKLIAGKDLNMVEMKKVLQPMKPVYVEQVIDKNSGISRKVYIKSSSFPLLPQLTRTLEIDRLRRIMEGVDENNKPLLNEDGTQKYPGRNAISRASYNTAAKVGSAFAQDWQTMTAESAYNAASKNVLPRSGFRIQQELPWSDTKYKITKGSQETKLTFVNILDIDGFEYKGSKTGSQLQKEYNDLHHNLYQRGYEELLKEVTDDGGALNIEKIQKLLSREAIERGYSLSDIQSLGLHEINEIRKVFEIPLWANASANKFESLLTSIVSSRVTKMKLPGYSAALGSEAGFITSESEEGREKIKDNRIVFSKNFNKKEGLLPMREDKNGNILPGQVLAPMKLKDNNGNPIDITQIMDENGMIDTTKVDESVLLSMGFRIPTQGLNSMTYIEVVGFLPHEMGDLVIASQDLVAQMGSDFDIDKLYAYMYNTETTYEEFKKDSDDDARILADYNEWAKDKENPSRIQYAKETEGVYFFEDSSNIANKGQTFFVDTNKNPLKIKSIKKYKGNDDIKNWQNDLLDIHFAVLSNPHKDVQYQIAEPLEFGKLPEAIADLYTVRQDKEAKDKTFIGISDEHQKQVFLAGRAGQIGIGVFSVDSTFNALAQGKGLKSIMPNPNYSPKTNPDEPATIPNPITFMVEDDKGNLKELASDNFSSIHSITNPNRYKSQIIAGFQSASVDNANEQILQKLNINNTTFTAYSAFNQLGWEEEYSAGIITQKIILDLVREVEILKDSTSASYSSNPMLEAAMIVRNKYSTAKTEQELIEQEEKLSKNPYLSAAELKEANQVGENYGEFERVQLLALNYFLKANNIGEQLQYVKYAINTESKHLGKSLIETQYKEDRVYSLPDNKYIENVTALLGNFTVKDVAGFSTMELDPTTINGFATKYALQTVNELFGNQFPYNAEGINNAMMEIMRISNITPDGSSMNKVFDMKRDIFNAMKSFIFSKNLGFFEGDINTERKKLLYDTVDTKGKKISKISFGVDNINSINNGTKTTTIRSAKDAGKIGIAKGKSAIVRIGSKYFEVTSRGPQTVEEAGGKTAMIASEDFAETPGKEGGYKIKINGETKFAKYQQTAKWLEGEGTLTVYDIKPATDIEIKESLASKVHAYSKTVPGKRNPLIRLLTTDLDLTGENPSTIKFNASAGENLDESHLHGAFIELLTSKDPAIVELAQNLITYSYITGGIQGATNFIKYIPPAYLTTTGMPLADGGVISIARALRDVGNNFNTNFVFGSESEIDTQYPAIGNFALQYFQHNPNEAPTLATTKVPGKKGKKLPLEFYLKIDKKEFDHLGKKINVGGMLATVPKEVISVYDPKKSEYILYQNTGATNNKGEFQFIQIDTAGYKGGITEYNPITTRIKSLTKNNQVPLVKKAVATKAGLGVIASKQNNNKTENNTNGGNKILRELNLENVYTTDGTGLPYAINALNTMQTTATSPGNKMLAAVISNALANEKPLIDLQIIKEGEKATDPKGVKWEITSGMNMRYVGPNFKDPSPNALRQSVAIRAPKDATSKSFFEDTFLHEFTHTLTSYKLEKNNNKTTKAIQDTLDHVITLVNSGYFEDRDIGGGFKLNKATLDQFKEDFISFKVIRETPVEDRTDAQKQILKRWKTYSSSGAISTLYSLINVYEFVAMGMSDPKFQLFLNTIPYKNTDRSVWEKLVELITDFLKEYTIGTTGQRIIEDSALEAVVANTITLMGPETKLPGTPIPTTTTKKITPLEEELMSLMSYLANFEKGSKEYNEVLDAINAIEDKIKKASQPTQQDSEVKKALTGMHWYDYEGNTFTKKDFDKNVAKFQKENPGFEKFEYNQKDTPAGDMFNVFFYSPSEAQAILDKNDILIDIKTFLKKSQDETFTGKEKKAIDELYSIQPAQTSEVEVVSRYTNTDVKNNPNKIYVFGDNTERKGTGGQAQIRNNENAFGIATKFKPSTGKDAYFYDSAEEIGQQYIDADIAKIKADGRPVVFPKDGLGTGLAKLKEKAPETYAYLKQRLQEEFGFNNDTGVVSKPTQSGKKATIFKLDPIFEKFPAGTSVLFNNKGRIHDGQEGTVVGISSDSTKVRVKFSDGTTMEVLPKNLKKGVKATVKPAIKGKPVPNFFSTTTRNIVLPNGTTISLNKEQDKAVTKVEAFLNGDNDTFTLIGRGGTGKTTIINEALKGKNFIAVAPTNKAKQVIGNAIGDPALDKTYTVAQLLAAKLQWENGKKVFAPNEEKIMMGEAPISRANIIVIDEASMIDKKTLDYIIKYKQAGAKVIFMGDNVQLAPVGSNERSPIFNIPGAKLTERMRQGEDHPIVSLTDNYANNVEIFQSGKNGKLDPLTDRTTIYDKDSDSGVIFTTQNNTLIPKIVADVQKGLAENNFDYVKAIAYTNALKTSLNNQIRGMLTNNNPEEYIEGDILVMNEGYPQRSDAPPSVFNSETIKIISAKKRTVKDYTLGTDVEVYSLVVEKENGAVVPMDVLSNASKVKANIVINKLLNTAKKTRAWRPYYSAMEYMGMTYGDVDYGYAITSHKAQGSTYRNVYVFEDNILGVTKASVQNRNQSLYVATSRASHKLVMVGKRNATANTTNTQGSKEPDIHSVPVQSLKPADNTATPTDLGIFEGFQSASNLTDSEISKGEQQGPPSIPPPTAADISGIDIDESVNGAYLITDNEYKKVTDYIKDKYILKPTSYWYKGVQYRDPKKFNIVAAQKLSKDIQNYYPWITAYVQQVEDGKALVQLSDNRAAYNAEKSTVQSDESILDESPTATEMMEEVEKISGYQQIINYKKSRVSTLNRSISKFSGNPTKSEFYKRRKEILENEINVLQSEETISAVVSSAQREIDDMQELLSQAKTGEGDYRFIITNLNEILNSALFWKESMPLLFTERQIKAYTDAKKDTELDPSLNTYGSSVELMNNIVSTATQMKHEVSDLMRENLLKAMQSTPGIDGIIKLAADDLKQFKDLDVLSGNFMDISRTGNEVLMAVDKWMRDAVAKTNDEANNLFNDLETAVEEVHKSSLFRQEGWNIFGQLDEDGNLTGQIVSRFSQKFFNKRIALRKRAEASGNWKSYFNWKKDNEIVFDFRKLFFEDYESDFTEVDREAHIDELKKALGEKGFNKYMANVEKKYNKFKEAELAAFTRIESTQENIALQMAAKDLWSLKNSPFVYVDVIEGKKSNKIGTEYIKPQGWQNTMSIPKKTTSDGKETGWYDSKYEAIENDPALENFYHFFTDTVNHLFDYLPDTFTEDLQMNTLPELKKTLIEKIFEEKNLKNGFTGIFDAFGEMISSKESNEVVRQEINPITGKPEPTFPVTMLRGELTPEEKSYDLDKVLKVFATMAISFKHKSKVEDQIRLANQVISEAIEIQQTPDGRLKTDTFNRVLGAKGELGHLRAHLQHAIDTFYGQGKPVQGVQKTKVYTWEELKAKKEATAEIQELTTKLENKEITEEQYDIALKAIEDKYNLSNMGRNFTWSKLGDTIIQYVQLKGMGWNVFSAITNMIYGNLSNMIHANGRKDFSLGDLRKAFSIMLHSSGTNLTVGYKSTSTSNKIRNLMIKYDVLKEFNEEANKASINSNKNTKGAKKLLPYELQRSSEYFVQGQEMIAFMLATKLDPTDENSPNLWEAYNENGNLKEEYSGKYPEWEGDVDNDNDNVKRYQFKSRLDQILKATHGNYDPNSAVRIKKGILGRFTMQFRSWVAEGFATRFEEEKDDLLLGRKRKGRYRTIIDIGPLNAIATLAKQAAYRKNAFEVNGEKLSDTDIENMRKNLAELATYISITAFVLVLKAMDDDDEEVAPQAVINFMLNQAFRLENDIAFFTSPIAFEAISRNAVPAFSLIMDSAKFLEASWGYLKGEDEISTGINAGESRLKRASGKVVPFTNQYYKLRTTTEFLFEQ